MRNRDCGLSITLLSAVPSWSLCPCSICILPQNATLVKLILCGLHTGCSSHSTNLTWPHTTGTVLHQLLHIGVHRLQFWPGAASAGYPWAVPPLGLIHCCPMGSSMAAHGDLLCVVPMGCRETACSSMGLP